MSPLRVAIVGGTHGNELTGVKLVEALEPLPERWSALEVRTLLGNLRAMSECRRFIDQDLNRSFRRSHLADATRATYEDARAREIAAELCPGGTPAVDFIIDLHTTTSAMDVSLLLCTTSAFEVELCAHVERTVPSRTLLLGTLWRDELPYLKALAPTSLAIEVGPVPQGVVRHDILEATRQALFAALDFADAVARGATRVPSAPALEGFEALENVPYPRDASGRLMFVHRELQDGDWEPLRAGQPLFAALDGTVEVCPPEWEGLCPVFVNEAAYYPSTAFVLTRPTRVLGA